MMVGVVNVVVVFVVNATAAALCSARTKAATMLTVCSVFAIYVGTTQTNE